MSPLSGRYPDIYIGQAWVVDSLRIRMSSAFPDAAGDGTWPWTVMVDKERVAGGTPDLSHVIDTVSLSEDKLTITLSWTAPIAKTEKVLAGGNIVEIKSNPGGEGEDRPWPDARGPVNAVIPLGTAAS